MSTGNFYSKNASSIFAFGMNCTDDEFIFDDSIDNLKYGLKERFNDDKDFDFFIDPNNDYVDNARTISRIDIDRGYMDTTVSIQLTVVARSGYYDGANFDYEIDVVIGDTNYDHDNIDVDDIEEHLFYDSDKKGLSVIGAPKLLTHIENDIERITTEVENVIKQYSDSFSVVGLFSNGETIYSKTA